MLALSFFAALPILAGCPGKDDEEEATSLLNENNYSWSGGLNIPSYETAEKVDVKIDWGALTTDMLCHDLDPVADIDSIGLTRFPRLSESEVSQGLTNNSLLQSDTNGYVGCEVGDETSCMLSDLNFSGTSYDTVSVYEEAQGTFLLSISEGTDPGKGVRAVGFLSPRAESTVTEANLEDNCDIVAMDVDMEALTKLAIPAGETPTIEWSSVSVAGNGEPVIPGDLDQVMVAHYTQSVTELEAGFLDIETLASELYTLQLDGGTEAGLLGLVTEDGTGFSGFTTDGTWLLALRCLECTNPAPIFLTVVDVQ
jgi:hypothetical protein